MKPYQFKLEALLFKRQSEEDMVQEELAKAMSILRQVQEKLTNAFEAYRSHRFEREMSTLSPAELRLFTNYANALLDKIQKYKEEVRSQQKIVDEIKSRLLIRHREKRVVEVLKEKDFTAYQKAVRKEETKHIDEMNVLRFNNKPGDKT